MVYESLGTQHVGVTRGVLKETKISFVCTTLHSVNLLRFAAYT